MISLVIPVYNKAPYLRRCLDSVKVALKRASDRVQVIVVDDASTDGSGAICDEYVGESFWICHLPGNVGVAGARNFGIGKVKGGYVAFLDADDALTPEAFEVMERAALKGHKIIQFGKLVRAEATSVGRIYAADHGRYDLAEVPKAWVTVWNKIYRYDFLKKHDITFPEGMSFGEDTIFNLRAILASRGLYHAKGVSVIHYLDDQKSLCRGQLSREKIEELDAGMVAIAENCKDEGELEFAARAINEHRASGLYHKLGYQRGRWSPHDVVYVVRGGENEELKYSVRSVEANFAHRRIVLYGGKVEVVEADLVVEFDHPGLTKWDRARATIEAICRDARISPKFWLFNDDFFVLHPDAEGELPYYTGTLIERADEIEKRQGHADDYTARLRAAAKALQETGRTSRCYETHTPMLIGRAEALEVLEKFPNAPCFRSLYGNYWGVGGVRHHDVKFKTLRPPDESVKMHWSFVSSTDKSFSEGGVGEFIRELDRENREAKTNGNTR